MTISIRAACTLPPQLIFAAPPVGPESAERGYRTAVYDRAETRMVIFGGWSFSGGHTSVNDAWALAHANGLADSLRKRRSHR